MLRPVHTYYQGLIFRLTFFAVLLLSCRPAAAHLDKGPMPDAIAEMEYRILLEFEPDNHAIRNRLGMVLFRKNKLEEAAAEFRYILNKAPANADAADGLGIVLEAQGKPAEAIIFFQQALAASPLDISVYLHLGRALVRTDQRHEAEEVFHRGLELIDSLPPEKRNAEAEAGLRAGLLELTAPSSPDTSSTTPPSAAAAAGR